MINSTNDQDNLFRQEALDFQKERLYGSVFVSPSKSQWFITLALVVWVFVFLIWINVATYKPIKQLHGWVENKNLLSEQQEEHQLLFAYLVVPVEDLSEFQEKTNFDVSFEGVENGAGKIFGLSILRISNSIIRSQDSSHYIYLDTSTSRSLQARPSVLLQLRLPNQSFDTRIVSGMKFTLPLEKKSQRLLQWIFKSALNNKIISNISVSNIPFDASVKLSDRPQFVGNYDKGQAA